MRKRNKKKNAKRAPKKTRGAIETLIVFGIAAFALLMAGGLALQHNNSSPNVAEKLTPIEPTIANSNTSLQLNTVQFVTQIPTEIPPTQKPQPRPTTKPSNPSDPCAGIGTIQTVNIDANGKETKSSGCDSKPVILLYPKADTEVSVQLNLPGKLLVSIPDYPLNTGWQHIIARPDGTLLYEGKEYTELFYEAEQQNLTPPQKGFIVAKQNLSETLTNISTQLGLTHSEQQEFLSYWVSRLNALQTPYVFVSVFSPEQQKLIDQISITPVPDTFINFTMYFKGVTNPYAVDPLAPLVLPIPPTRKGFTAVRWGGILDH